MEANEIVVDVDNRTGYELEQYYETVAKAAVGALKHEGVQACGVSVSFVLNEEIKVLNKRYRGQDKVTDVLSFPAIDDFAKLPGGHFELGDVVIAYDKAAKQAAEYGHSLMREIGFLTVQWSNKNATALSRAGSWLR